MPFQVSPGVNISEIDLTTVIPAVSTTQGAIAGRFHWGPADKIILVSDEDVLESQFGKPDSDNYQEWFTAKNFLAYGNALWVSRILKRVIILIFILRTIRLFPAFNLQLLVFL